MQQKLSALWIVGWFPTKSNPFAGNFIKRHAIACSNHVDIHVLHASTHFFGQNPVSSIEGENSPSKSYQLHLISIPQFRSFILKPINLLLYYFKYWQFAKKVVTEIDTVDVLHLHVPDKCGFIAIWLKKLLQKPLVLTEHWAIYNTPVPDHFLARNWFFRWHFKKVWQSVDATAQVSLQLHSQMEILLGEKKPVKYFPNVVPDEFCFNATNQKLDRFTLIHVSNGEPRKNIPLIFASAIRLFNSGVPINLLFVGFEGHLASQFEMIFDQLLKQELKNSKNDSDFQWEILGKKYPSEINELFQKAHCLVMASSSENAPCVISEALCTGLPVITSSVGGIAEMVNSKNGILFDLKINENEDPAYNKTNIESLYHAMLEMKENVLHYQKEEIAENAKQIYGAKNISNVLNQLYLGL